MNAVMKPYVKKYNTEGELLNPLISSYLHPLYQGEDLFGNPKLYPYPNHNERRRMSKSKKINNRKLTRGRVSNRIYHPLFNYFDGNSTPITSQEYKKLLEKKKNCYKLFTGKFKIVQNLN
jgi:hypothetical protein